MLSLVDNRSFRRLAYRVLKRRFQLDDYLLEDLKEDLIYAKQVAAEQDTVEA